MQLHQPFIVWLLSLIKVFHSVVVFVLTTLENFSISKLPQLTGLRSIFLA